MRIEPTSGLTPPGRFLPARSPKLLTGKLRAVSAERGHDADARSGHETRAQIGALRLCASPMWPSSESRKNRKSREFLLTVEEPVVRFGVAG